MHQSVAVLADEKYVCSERVFQDQTKNTLSFELFSLVQKRLFKLYFSCFMNLKLI